jgi:hypothetical protein
LTAQLLRQSPQLDRYTGCMSQKEPIHLLWDDRLTERNKRATRPWVVPRPELLTEFFLVKFFFCNLFFLWEFLFMEIQSEQRARTT